VSERPESALAEDSPSEDEKHPALDWVMPAKLTQIELQEELARLPAWSIVGDKLRREYQFANFTLAFGFMAASATIIEKMNHHPEWSNVYGTVVVELVTHDADSITCKDTALAAALEELAQRLL
jgi:4a-hydroxytetrahydrobiopterin dehydratase